MRNEYVVGYGKPPKHTRFQKGQSGNRQGRPKGVRNLKTDLRDITGEELSLAIGGREVKLPARRAVLVALRNKALKGDVRAIVHFIALLERLLPETLVEEVQTTIDSDDLAIFNNAIERQIEARRGK